MADQAENSALELATRIIDGDAIAWPDDPDPLVASLKKIASVVNHYSRVHEEPGSEQFGAEHWGHLKVGERIGVGGFGDVFRAHDTVLKRAVALKLRRANTQSGDARVFIDEARKMAQVRHPNVLAVHGADVHMDRVGIWMDLLNGQTLEQLLDASDGPLDELQCLDLLMGVALGLAAIHTAGLLHGDVKAANVMLEDDGRIVVMDFGAAAEMQTNVPGLFASPMYAAPEVLAGEPATQASDIYSLGVLLHRMLAGCFPFEARTLDELVQYHQQAPVFARLPGSPLGLLCRGLLSTDPKTRPNAAQVVLETERIQDLPRRRRRRNGVAAVVGSLVLGIAISLAGLFEARSASARAERNAAELGAVNNFLRDLLVSPRPTDAGRNTTVMELLLEAQEKIASDLEMHPLAQARTLDLIGATYDSMQLHEQAIEPFRQALALRAANLAEADSQRLATRTKLAMAQIHAGDLEGSKQTLAPVLRIRDQISSHDPVHATSRIVEALQLFEQEELVAAAELYQQVLDLHEQPDWSSNSDYRRAQLNLAVIQERTGEYAAAKTQLEDLLAWSLENHGEKHVMTLSAWQNLAIVEDRVGDVHGALELMEQIYATTSAWLGNEDMLTLKAAINASTAAHRSGNSALGLKYLREAKAMGEELLAVTHPTRLAIEMNFLGLAATQTPQDADLVQRYAALLPDLVAAYGAQHVTVARARMAMVNAGFLSGQYALVRRLAAAQLPLMHAAIGSEHTLSLTVESMWGAALGHLDELARSEQILRDVLQRQRTALGEGSVDLLLTRMYLAETLATVHPGEARALLEPTIAEMQRQFHADDYDLRYARELLARLPPAQ